MHATNLTELIRTDALDGLLRLCGTEERVLTHGSDYDFFLAVCRALPLLCGHPFPKSLHCFLSEQFAITQPITPDSTAVIWRAVADELLLCPTAFPVSIKPQPPEEWTLPQLNVQKEVSIWGADDLVNVAADSMQAWESELRTRFDARDGASRILLTLSERAAEQKPNPYRVRLSLQAKPRTSEDLALLRAQAVRFFCLAAKRHGEPLILRVGEDCRNPVGFLEWLEETAGLPSLLVAASKKAFPPLLAFASRAHSLPICLAIDRARYPSRAAFEADVRELAESYPLGRLWVLDGARMERFDLPYETESLEKPKRI